MKTRYAACIVWMAIVCVGAGMKTLYQSIPAEVDGWTARDKDEFYDADTLYGLIDGGAELYLSYGFVEAFVRNYAGPAGQDISLEIYDMGSSADAYGVFSVERQDEDVGIGSGSEYGGGLLRFWKDRYFVSVTSIGDETVVRPVMTRIAREVARAIRTPGTVPRLVSALPEQGLRETTIRFFHTSAILNRQYFLSNRNILRLNKHTDCVLAGYAEGGHTARLLLVRYGSADLARDAYDSFVESYMPEARDTGRSRMENGTWGFVRVEEELLIVVLEASDESLGRRLSAESIRYRE